MLTKLVLVVAWISCVSLRQSDAQMVVDSKCRIPNSEISGECKLLKNCQKAMEDIRNNSTLPIICGFSEFHPIVCCDTQIATTSSVNSIWKRVEKCNEYANSVYEERSEMLLLPINDQTKNVKVDNCAINNIPLIITYRANPREFPHFTLLGYNDTDTGDIGWHCGGSLVSSRYVLTAAHCLRPRHLGPVQIVRLGDITANQVLTDILVQQIIPHPDFSAAKLYNDIGLIKMAEKIQFSKFIRPICLPTSDQFPSTLIEAGWEFEPILDINKDKLLREPVQIITNEECNLHFQQVNRKLRDGIIDTQLCTRITKDANFCKGDMLQMYHSDTYCMYTQIGVASFGSSCMQAPSIYTRVFKYSDWIEEIIWGPGEDD